MIGVDSGPTRQYFVKMMQPDVFHIQRKENI